MTSTLRRHKASTYDIFDVICITLSLESSPLVIISFFPICLFYAHNVILNTLATYDLSLICLVIST